MRVAVVGGSGQLGTHVLRLLARSRAVREIVSVDEKPPIVASAKLHVAICDPNDPGLAHHLSGAASVVLVDPAASALEAVARATALAKVDHLVVASAGSVSTAALEREHAGVAAAHVHHALLLGARMEHAFGRALLAGVVPDGGGELSVAWDEDVAGVVALAVQRRAAGEVDATCEGTLGAAELARLAGLRRVPVPRALASRLVPASNPPPPSRRATEAFGWRPRCPTAGDAARRLGEVATRREDLRIATFMRLASLGARRVARGGGNRDLPREARIHIEITGKGGADWSFLVDERRPRIVRGVPRAPTSVVTISASALLDMLAGRTSTATAQLTGKVRVEGDPVANMVVLGLVALFRATAEEPRRSAWPARRLARWFGQTAPP